MAAGCSQAHVRWTVISLNSGAHHRCSLPTLQPLLNAPRQGLRSPLWYDAWLDGNCYSRQHQLVKAYQLMRSPRADASPALFPNTHTQSLLSVAFFCSIIFHSAIYPIRFLPHTETHVRLWEGIRCRLQVMLIEEHAHFY